MTEPSGQWDTAPPQDADARGDRSPSLQHTPRPAARSAEDHQRGGAVDARLAAYDALIVWQRGGTRTVVEGLPPLTGADAGLARDLAQGVMRHRRLYDHLADRFLDRRHDQPEPLRLALAIGAHQLFSYDRIPVHAAVERSVAILHHRGQQRLVGVANAVLRRLSELRLDERRGPGPGGRLQPADLPADPAIRFSLPDALVADLEPLLGERGLRLRRLAALELPAPLCLRQRHDAPLADHPAILRRDGPWSWWADPIAALDGPVASGTAVVQDRAQGVALERLGPVSGLTVLDCCAAPGGKSLWLHDHGAQVTAADVHPDKCRALRASLPEAITVSCRDAREPWPQAGFDGVVVDAPCSNSGVMARRVEARWRYDADHLASLATVQNALLRAAATAVRPGGWLAYSTCSICPQENGLRARSVPGWRVEHEWLTWPDAWQGGGYIAVLRRGQLRRGR